MLIDNALMFSNRQSITADGASTNYIDLSNLINLGTGEPVAVVVCVDVVTSGTINFIVQTDNNTSFSSPTAIAQTGNVTPSDNSRIVIPIPPGSATERYMRLFYDWTSGSFSVTAFITEADMIQNEAVYPAGYTIQ